MRSSRNINEQQYICQFTSGKSLDLCGFMHNLFNFLSFNITINENFRALSQSMAPNSLSSFNFDYGWNENLMNLQVISWGWIVGIVVMGLPPILPLVLW